MLTMQRYPLADWIDQQLVENGGKFNSLNELAIVARISRATLFNAQKTGKADPSSLLKIAQATGGDPVQLMVMAGHIPQEALDRLAWRALPPSDQRLLQEFHQADAPIRGVIETLLEKEREKRGEGRSGSRQPTLAGR